MNLSRSEPKKWCGTDGGFITDHESREPIPDYAGKATPPDSQNPDRQWTGTDERAGSSRSSHEDGA